ncbi:GNAT family N-acetyltransferase [Actinacidiphila rubida]|uniref:Protein N-acetyltransferase, RimJ/RimL family n=1 Tax=Actinacidiphila rubida TaxID=310780 RepID=A0A1H8NVH5_9ACTN|nr:GNAT family N-acetyltransferase [Actinacidiphila rubida]SEO33665.1 Protein N-acetyltransferase, RimJ/RimL family [Actinacidiphila rubida]
MTGGGSGGLAALLDGAARGVFPPADGSVTFLPQPSDRDAGVIAFTAHAVVFTDADHAELAALLPADDLGAPLSPPFLTALSARSRRDAHSIDVLTVAQPLSGPPPLDLRETLDRSHPRIARALRHRDDVRAWTVPGGTLVIGRGVAGRWEAALEVEPDARGSGLGRALARAARHLVPGGAPLWAQAAPGNAASLRALLSAGFAPVGAEALLVRPGGAG